MTTNITIIECAQTVTDKCGLYTGKTLNGNKSENYLFATLLREMAHGNKIACEVQARYEQYKATVKDCEKQAKKVIKDKESIDDMSPKDSKNLHDLWNEWAEAREHLNNDVLDSANLFRINAFESVLRTDESVFPETLKFQAELAELYDEFKAGKTAFHAAAAAFCAEKFGEVFPTDAIEYLQSVAGRKETRLYEKADGQFKAVSKAAFCRNLTAGLIEIACASGIVSQKWLKVVCKKADKAAE